MPFFAGSLSEMPLRSGSDTELTGLPSSKFNLGVAEKKHRREEVVNSGFNN